MDQSSNLSGMYVIGTVMDRRKREIVKDANNIEIVTYDIKDDEGHTYYVEAFNPEHYYDRDQYVQIPVYVKAYKKKTGDAAYTLNVRGENVPSNRGTAF